MAYQPDKIASVVEDTSPQLGGDLDVNGQDIISASDGDISITPNGTGDLILDGLKWPQADGTANQILKTDGSAQLSWTDGGAPAAHKNSHDPEDGSDALDCAAPSELAGVQAAGEGSAHSFARSDHAHQIQASIADDHLVTIDSDSVAENDYAKFTTAGLKGMSYSEVMGDLAGQALNMQDALLTRPQLKDYSENVNALGNVGTDTYDIDLEDGNVVTCTLTGNPTFTFSNPPGSGDAGSFTLIVTEDASPSITWPASVDWAGGDAPDLTTSGVDIFTFVTVDGGTTWYGFAAGLDMS